MNGFIDILTLCLTAGFAQLGSPPIQATFSAQGGVLVIEGDAQDNQIAVGRTREGTLLVNGGSVPIIGGPATIRGTRRIVVCAGAGDDKVVIDESNGRMPASRLEGGDGHDLLIGGSGTDFLFGEAGNDTLRGGDEMDEMYGGTGNDILLGDTGNDRVEGQDGNDLLIWNDGDGSDFLDGGLGTDVVEVNGDPVAGDDIVVAMNDGYVECRNNLRWISLAMHNAETMRIRGQGGSDVIVAAAGLGGIDLELDGGDGNDLLVGGRGDDVLTGGDGHDVLISGDGNDILLGGDGDDVLAVGARDGDDLIEGGLGRDTVRVAGDDGGKDDLWITSQGDRVQVRSDTSFLSVDIGTCEALHVDGRGGDDRMIVTPGWTAPMSITLMGGDGDDVLRGGDGNDVLLGGDGDDILDGGLGWDFADGGPGRDTAIDCEQVVNVP